MPIAPSPVSTSAHTTPASWCGQAGAITRWVVGAAEPPAVSFLNAPAFVIDHAAITRAGDGFVCQLAGGPALRGRAQHQPLLLDLDVGDAEIFGFGAGPSATRNNQRFVCQTRDTIFFGIPGASYTAMPYVLIKRGSHVTAVLLATTFALAVAVENGRLRIRGLDDTEGTPLDVWLWHGTALEVQQTLARLVGTTFLPPAWALGFHQSRWSYKTQQEVLSIGQRFRALDLPIDVVHLDIHYMDRYRVFTWDKKRFPEPTRMHQQLHAMGVRTLAIVDPGVSVADGYDVYETGKKQQLFMTKHDGALYEGKVWPGATVFPDLIRDDVKQAWAGFHRPLLTAGVAGFWNDMNDPVLRVAEVYDPLKEDLVHQAGSHARYRNVYANHMAQATVAGLVAHAPAERPFVLTRSGFLGIQRHAAVWTGDNLSRWSHLSENLHMVIHLGLCGVPLVGADVGGFGGRPGKYGAIKCRPSKELFVRWMELGALMPFFRVHTTLYSPRQEPWSFGERTLNLSRRLLKRRYRMLPLLYALAHEAHRTGLPLIRPLWMHDDAPQGADHDVAQSQFLLGRDVLCAPILTRGAVEREVWLPQGQWTAYENGVVFDGNQRIKVAAPLGQTPLFFRDGAAVFSATAERNAEDSLAAALHLELYPPRDGHTGHGTLFLDDGHTQNGASFFLDVTHHVTREGWQVAFARRGNSPKGPPEGQNSPDFAPPQRTITLRVPLHFSQVIVDGVAHALTPHGLAHEDRTHTVNTVTIPITTQTLAIR